MTAYSSDGQAAHLLKLSNEVSRIAGSLARLSLEPGAAEPLPDMAFPAEEVQVSAERVNAFIRARRLRERFFPDDLFADPAWDMMLGLFCAELRQYRISVSSLCAAAAVPSTTALRWLNSLIDKGICVRRRDLHDGRRVFIELSPEASSSLHRYFAAVPAL